jgi:hypothetical protein
MAAAVPPPLTPEDVARQRRRSVALACVLGAMVVMFYLVTLVKTGAPLPTAKTTQAAKP